MILLLIKPSESMLRLHISQFMTLPAGSSLDVHCMYRCTPAIPMSERSAPAQDHGVILQVNGVILQGHSIIEVLWPNILNAWLTKEQLDEELQLKWKTVKLCLQACKKLGSAKTAILTVSQLYISHGQWSPFADLRQRNCHLSREEHTALINCLSAADVSGRAELQVHVSGRAESQALADSPGETNSTCLNHHSW
jgi:hypothetical protein